MVRSASGVKAHDGSVVIVGGFYKRWNGYKCRPQLTDPADGADLYWMDASLYPLGHSDEPDEMVRRIGLPMEAECTKS
jgi:hypothetical protein